MDKVPREPRLSIYATYRYLKINLNIIIIKIITDKNSFDLPASRPPLSIVLWIFHGWKKIQINPRPVTEHPHSYHYPLWETLEYVDWNGQTAKYIMIIWTDHE